MADQLIEEGKYKTFLRPNGNKVMRLFPKQEVATVEPPVNLVNELPWNNNPTYPFPSELRTNADIYYWTIHHGVSWALEWWNDYHTNTKGWSHVGYHFCITTYQGELGLWQANEIPQVTWHDTYNYHSFAATWGGWMEAGHDPGRPTDEQLQLFGRLCAWLDITNANKWPNLRNIVGHKFFSATACPGDLPVYAGDMIDVADDFGQDIQPLLQTGAENFISYAVHAIARRGPGIDESEHIQLLEKENNG